MATSSDRIGEHRVAGLPAASPCFTPGTLIETVRGALPVEDLAPGDLLLTRDNGYRPILWCGQRHLTAADLAAAPVLRPIRIARGALGRGLPERDMLVSPQHRVMIANDRTRQWFGEEEVLAAALHMTIFEGIDQVDPPDGVTYLHLMCDRHELILSERAWTESFQPVDRSLGALGKEAREEILALFPDLKDAKNRFGPARRVLDRKDIDALKDD